jgi:hypothetical protein
MGEYVMVPVPEDVAEDVRRFVQWTTGASERPALDPPTVSRALATLDPPCRQMLSLVAQATVSGKGATITRIARALRCSPREVMGTMLDLNHLMRIGDAAVALIPQRVPGVPDDELDERIITMTEDAARVVVAAERLDPPGGVPVAGT